MYFCAPVSSLLSLCCYRLISSCLVLFSLAASSVAIESMAKNEPLSLHQQFDYRMNLNVLKFVLPNLVTMFKEYLQLILALRGERANLHLIQLEQVRIASKRDDIQSRLSKAASDANTLKDITSMAHVWKLRGVTQDLSSLRLLTVYHIDVLQTLQIKAVEYHCVEKKLDKTSQLCTDNKSLVCLRDKQASIEQAVTACAHYQSDRPAPETWHQIDLAFGKDGIPFDYAKQEFQIYLAAPEISEGENFYWDKRIVAVSGVSVGIESESNDVTVIVTRKGPSQILDENGNLHNFEMDTRTYQSHFNLKQCRLISGVDSSAAELVHPSVEGQYTIRLRMNSKIKRIEGFSMLIKVSARQTTSHSSILSPKLVKGLDTKISDAFRPKIGCSHTTTTTTTTTTKKCAPGKYQSHEGKTSCLECVAGKYQSNAQSSSCDICPNGQYQPHEGQSACKKCVIGYYGSGSGKTEQTQCLICPAGLYSSSPGSTSCTLCPIGRYGSGSGKNLDGCQSCPLGKYGTHAGAISCQKCVPGKYQSHEGKTTCHKCVAGKYQSSMQSSSCDICPNGQYHPHEGQSACKKCAIGYYGSGSGKTEQTQCLICPTGRYSSSPGSTSCTCLLYTSPSPRDYAASRMPSSA